MLYQPISGQAGEELRSALVRARGAPGLDILVTAWAKSSGVEQLREALSAFRAAGGHVTSAVGIDLRGTSREGLDALRSLSDECYVCHDLGNRVFHPKYYLVAGANFATVIVGSGNLTLGGLFRNYEIFSISQLDLNSNEDRYYFDELLRGIQALIENEDTSKRANDELVRLLVLSNVLPEEASMPRHDERPGERLGVASFGSRTDLPDSPVTRANLIERLAGRPDLSRGLLTYRKALTANDVGITGGHQAGITVSKQDIGFFPALDERVKNPRVLMPVIDESGREWKWRFIHYNNKVIEGGTRDEYRVTGMTGYLRDAGAVPGDIITVVRTRGDTYRVSLRLS